jgi:hypothetical protein
MREVYLWRVVRGKGMTFILKGMEGMESSSLRIAKENVVANDTDKNKLEILELLLTGLEEKA